MRRPPCPRPPAQATLKRQASREAMSRSPRHGSPTPSLGGSQDSDDGEGEGGRGDAQADAGSGGGAVRRGARTALLIPVRAGFEGEMPFMGNAAPNAVLHPYSGEEGGGGGDAARRVPAEPSPSLFVPLTHSPPTRLPPPLPVATMATSTAEMDQFREQLEAAARARQLAESRPAAPSKAALLEAAEKGADEAALQGKEAADAAAAAAAKAGADFDSAEVRRKRQAGREQCACFSHPRRMTPLLLPPHRPSSFSPIVNLQRRELRLKLLDKSAFVPGDAPAKPDNGDAVSSNAGRRVGWMLGMVRADPGGELGGRIPRVDIGETPPSLSSPPSPRAVRARLEQRVAEQRAEHLASQVRTRGWGGRQDELWAPHPAPSPSPPLRSLARVRWPSRTT